MKRFSHKTYDPPASRNGKTARRAKEAADQKAWNIARAMALDTRPPKSRNRRVRRHAAHWKRLLTERRLEKMRTEPQQ